MLNIYGYVEFMNVSEFIFLEWEFGKCQGVCAYIIDFFFGGGAILWWLLCKYMYCTFIYSVQFISTLPTLD